jgi:predicted nucleotidyltransferase
VTSDARPSETSEALIEGLHELIASRDWPGNIIYAKIWGSHSHNTQLPTSDVDYLLVYAAPRDAILGLFKRPDTVDGTKPDFQAHEVGKFCELLIKGNPAIVEMLFT